MYSRRHCACTGTLFCLHSLLGNISQPLDFVQHCRIVNNFGIKSRGCDSTANGAAMWLHDVFLIFFGQRWRCMAQRNKIDQALDTQLVGKVSLLLCVLCC